MKTFIFLSLLFLSLQSPSFAITSKWEKLKLKTQTSKPLKKSQKSQIKSVTEKPQYRCYKGFTIIIQHTKAGIQIFKIYEQMIRDTQGNHSSVVYPKPCA